MTEQYRCPEEGCYSTCVEMQESFGKVSVMCGRGHGLIMSRDYLVPVYPVVTKDTSDGHHTFEELYRYRLLYNAALFNEWHTLGCYDVHKSRKHHDGKLPFDDPKWFIVVAELPTGQISNHYRVATDWNLFTIEERELPNVYDGHTPAVVANRLREFLQP